MADSQRILVTGGSGYVASFCIAQLLDEGHIVRTTIRSLKREDDVRETLSKLTPSLDRLEVVEAELDSDGGWAAACEGCHAVLHVASPLPSSNPKDDDELVRPARDGALRVLRAARDAGVKRVVMTSSTAAISYGTGGSDRAFDESNWSDPANRADSSAYERSKILAERAAWDWHAREGQGLELVMICPGAVIGPVPGRGYSASVDIVKKLIDGSLPGLPRFGWPLVDVRDIADLHIRAMRADNAPGERFAGAGAFHWMKDVAEVLRAQVPEIAGNVPKRALPDWLVRVSALFDPIVKRSLFELGKQRAVSADKARQQLGWNPWPVSESIVATARSLIEGGFVKGK